MVITLLTEPSKEAEQAVTGVCMASVMANSIKQTCYLNNSNKFILGAFSGAAISASSGVAIEFDAHKKASLDNIAVLAIAGAFMGALVLRFAPYNSGYGRFAREMLQGYTRTSPGEEQEPQPEIGI